MNMESNHPLITSKNVNKFIPAKMIKGKNSKMEDSNGSDEGMPRGRRQSPSRKDMERMFLSAAIMAQAQGVPVTIPGTGLSIVPTSSLENNDIRELSARQISIDDGLLPDLPPSVPAVPDDTLVPFFPEDVPPPPPPPAIGECSTVIPSTGISCDPGLAFNPITGSCDWPDNLIEIGCIPEEITGFGPCPLDIADPILTPAQVRAWPFPKFPVTLDVINRYNFDPQTAERYFIVCVPGIDPVLEDPILFPRLLCCPYGEYYDPASLEGCSKGKHYEKPSYHVRKPSYKPTYEPTSYDLPTYGYHNPGLPTPVPAVPPLFPAVPAPVPDALPFEVIPRPNDVVVTPAGDPSTLEDSFFNADDQLLLQRLRDIRKELLRRRNP